MATVKRTLKSVQNAFCIIDKHHLNPHNCKSFIMKFVRICYCKNWKIFWNSKFLAELAILAIWFLIYFRKWHTAKWDHFFIVFSDVCDFAQKIAFLLYWYSYSYLTHQELIIESSKETWYSQWFSGRNQYTEKKNGGNATKMFIVRDKSRWYSYKVPILILKN